jgi:hypothetical protein
MATQKFIDDIISTNTTDFLSAIRVLLQQNNLDDNIFDIITLLDTYKLLEQNILNITATYLNDETFDISTYEG